MNWTTGHGLILNNSDDHDDESNNIQLTLSLVTNEGATLYQPMQNKKKQKNKHHS